MNGLKGLFNSRKATSTWALIAGLSALLIFGYLPAEYYAALIGSIKSVWLASHSHEESAKAKAGADLMDQVAIAATKVAAQRPDDRPEKESSR